MHHPLQLAIHTPRPPLSNITPLTNNNLPILGEIIRRNLQVERRRPLSYAPRDIVVRAMARTEPATKVARLANGHAAQVRADTQHDEPLGLLHALRVLLRVAQGLPLGVFGFLDLAVGAVADEDGLAAPLDDDLGVC